MARAPTTASAASTQKSIASMPSLLSLAVGYNRIVTHGRRSCNNVVATDLAGVLRGSGPYNVLGRAGAPLWCGIRFAPSLRALGFYNALGRAVFSLTHSHSRGLSLCALEALR